MFKKIDVDFSTFQEALNTHSSNISKLKFDYFLKTVDFLTKQTKNIDELVEESTIFFLFEFFIHFPLKVDEKYFEFLNKPGDFDKNFTKEEEEDEENATFDQDIDDERKAISVNNNQDTSEGEEEVDGIHKENLQKISSQARGIFLSKLFGSFFAEWSENSNFYVKKRKKLRKI